MKPGDEGEGGLVLVAVLWLLALLGGLTTAMALATRAAVEVIDASRDPLVAAGAIDAGVTAAVARLARPDPAPFGTASVAVPGARVSFTWSAETARIDVNAAPKELLAGLFARLGADADAAAAYAGRIVALRQGGKTPAPIPGRPAGFDPNEETPAAIKRLARGGLQAPGEADPSTPITDVIQLQQLPGLPPALMVRAAPFLTTYSGVAGIDARFAAAEIIEALPDMTRERVRTVMALRERRADASSLSDALGPAAKADLVDKPSAAVRIRVQAVLSDGFTAAAEVVIVSFPDDRKPYRVLSWDDRAHVRAQPASGAVP